MSDDMLVCSLQLPTYDAVEKQQPISGGVERWVCLVDMTGVTDVALTAR